MDHQELRRRFVLAALAAPGRPVVYQAAAAAAQPAAAAHPAAAAQPGVQAVQQLGMLL